MNVARRFVLHSSSNSSSGNLGQRSRGDVAAYGVDDGVDRTERLDRLVEEPLDVQIVGDVGADGDSSAASGQNRLHGRLGGSLVVDVVDDNGVPEAREPVDRLAADASRSPGDDRDATLG